MRSASIHSFDANPNELPQIIRYNITKLSQLMTQQYLTVQFGRFCDFALQYLYCFLSRIRYISASQTMMCDISDTQVQRNVYFGN